MIHWPVREGVVASPVAIDASGCLERGPIGRALSDPERELRVVFDGLLDPLVLMQPVYNDAGEIVDFSFLEANAAACAFWSTPRDEVLQSSLVQIVPDVGAAGLLDKCAAVATCGEPLVLDGFPHRNEAGDPDRYCDLRATRANACVSLTWRDVTERHDAAVREQQAQAALAESEDRFKYFFDRSAVGKVIRCPDGRITAVNDAFCGMLGYSREELEGSEVELILSPQDAAGLRETMARMIRGDIGEVRARRRLIAKDASSRWADVSASLRRDADGAPMYFIIAATDVTAQVVAEAEVARLNAMRDRAEEVAMMGSWSWDPRTGRAEWSRGVLRVLDLDGVDVVHGLHSVIAERLHPQDRDQVRELLARRGDDGDPPNHEARVVYRDGSEHIVHSAAALDPAEQGGMITGFVRDVTAERVAQEEATRSARSLAESESMLRAIVENAGEGITLLDLSSMRYVFVSPRMVEMTGFTMEELNALTADDGVFKRGHPDERDAAREQLRQIASGVVESGLAEYRWKVKNGEYRWFSDNRRLLRDPGGRPRALVAVMTDITVRKQIEAELRKGQEDYRTLLEAERAAQEEHQHVARDLHDAVAQNVFSASLLAEALPAIFRETPDKALDDLVLIRRLIRAVFAELRFLLFELRPETLAVDSMATLLERLGDVLAAKADLTVDLCVDEDLVLSPTSRAVCYHIAQEALNNVGRYAKAQHVVISLAREGQAMRLDVRDDGRGFNEDDCLEGVGMSIMREHARSIDGELTVASTLDVGTTVTLRWREPAQDAPD